MEPLKLVELFSTLQGEGAMIGTPSIFLRLGRCNLTCPGCDTKWDTWREVDQAEVADKILSMPEKCVVVTGGEPTLWQEPLARLVALVKMRRAKTHFTVETNGSVPINKQYLLDNVDLWSFSPKVGSLGRDEVFKWDVVHSNLMKVGGSKKQLKYVLDWSNEEDIRRIRTFHLGVDKFGLCPDTRVFFQPYDTGVAVNQLERVTPFVPADYEATLVELARVVGDVFGNRFRILPQLHKIMRSDLVRPRDERFNAIPAR